MAGDRSVRVSRYLALRLRHRPHEIGLVLDHQGWADVEALLAGAAGDGFPITREELELVVRTNSKARYELDPSRRRIRARQGHSVAVDLGLELSDPPTLLYHGTVARRLPLIGRDGLLPMGRHHVHLSPDRAGARAVGRRRGRPVVLSVLAAAMREHGHDFWLTANGVWLVDRVPPEYLVLDG